MDSLVQTPGRTEGAAGHRLCVYLRQLELLEPEVQFSQIWDSAGFIRRVSVGTHYRTGHDLDDGFGDNSSKQRIHVPSRLHPNPKSNFGSKVTPELAQFFESRPPVILTSTASRFRYPPHQETIPNLGLS